MDDDCYRWLASTVLAAPGQGASRSAVATLRQLAFGGDAVAAATLGAVVHADLMGAADVPAVRSDLRFSLLPSDTDLPPMVRRYAAAYHPAVFLGHLDRWADDPDGSTSTPPLAGFQRLVLRDAPTGDEALRAHLLGTFAGLYSSTMGESVGPLHRRTLLDLILREARLVEGHAVESSMTFGRDAILRYESSRAFRMVQGHELGHHVFDQMRQPWGRSAALQVTAVEALEAVAALRHLLPRAVSADRRGERSVPRQTTLRSGLQVSCSWSGLDGNGFLHTSMSDPQGLLDWSSAARLAYVQWCGLGRPAQVWCAFSPRGVVHLGARMTPTERREAKLRPSRSEVDRQLAEGPSWFDRLDTQGRVVGQEAELLVGLGVATPGPAGFGPDDVELSAADQDIVTGVRGLPGLAIPVEVAPDLARRAVRTADPEVAGLALAAIPDGERTGLDVGLEDLGRALFALRDGGRLSRVGTAPDGMVEVVGILGRAGVRTDVVVTESGRTLLTDAAARPSTVLSGLVAVGLDPDTPDRAGRLALTVAAGSGESRNVRLLLDAGAAVDLRDGDGVTALQVAAFHGDDDSCAGLLDAGALVDARSSTGRTALMYAASTAVSGMLLDAGADMEDPDLGGTTALLHAIGRGDVDVATDLLERGADATTSNDRGFAALHAAAGLWWSPVVEELVDTLLGAGADLEAADDDDSTPLMVAASRQDPAAVEALLARGADPHRSSVQGLTALLHASDGSRQWDRDPTTADRMLACMAALIERGVDVDAVDDAGDTALIRACRGFFVPAVELLLDAGADPNHRSRDGTTALDLARSPDLAGWSGGALVDLLRARGAVDGQEHARG